MWEGQAKEGKLIKGIKKALSDGGREWGQRNIIRLRWETSASVNVREKISEITNVFIIFGHQNLMASVE